MGVPADANGGNGYYTTKVIPTDIAGNIGPAFQATILADANAPSILSIDIPQTIAANTTVSFPAAAADTAPANSTTVGDLVGSWATLNYGAPGVTLQYAVTPGPGVAFDTILTRTATIAPAVPNFIKNLQVSTGGTTAPANTTANTSNVTSVTVAAQDAANNVGATNVAFSTQPVQFTGSATNFTATGSGATFFTGGFAISANPTTVSNCPSSGCGAAGSGTAAANATTTTITATATGQSGVFNNPFSAVQVWYRPTGTTTWFQASATAGATTNTDNGTNRSWNFTFSWDPPAATPASGAGGPQSLTPANGATISVDVMVIGINSNGDAVATNTTTITLTNP